MNYFGIVDYVILILTILFSLLIGIYYAYSGGNRKTTRSMEEIIVGRNMKNSWAMAISMLVSYLSAITIMGYPSEVYSFGVQLFIKIPIVCTFCVISAFAFVPIFYELQLTSIYEYLELRFESKLLRMTASFIFIIQCVFWSGLALYTPGIALEAFMGFPLWVSILSIGLSGAIYTCIGGFKAVIYTDVFQFFMILFGMIAIVIKGFISAGGFIEAFKRTQEHGRINLNLDIDFFQRLNLLNIFLGQAYSAFVLYGSHQLQVQRYCSLPSKREAIKSILYKIPLSVTLWALCILAGISIFATYSECDPIKQKKISKSDEILPYFVIDQLSFIPGMLGLFTSCIFSAVLSSISSSMNSLACVTWKDFLQPFPYFQNFSEVSKANIIRTIGFIYGLVFILVAFISKYLGPILQAAISAFGATSGPLGMLFIMALFVPCVNKQGALFGSLISLTIMSFIATEAFINKKATLNNILPTSIKSCPAINVTLYGNHNQSFVNQNNLQYFINSTSNLPVENNWIEQLSTLSYIIYPFVGGMLTLILSVFMGILTGGCDGKYRKRIDPYLHKCLRKHNVSKKIEKINNFYRAENRLEKVTSL